MQLVRKGFIATELEGPDQMRLEIVPLPNPAHCRLTHFHGLRHGAGAPMRRVFGLGMQRRVDDGANAAVRYAWNAAWPRRIFLQPIQPEREKALAPQLHRRARHCQGTSDLLAFDPGSGKLNNLRALNLPERQAAA